jgi:hypothetical protein
MARTSGLAIAALVVGILAVIGSIAWLGILLGPAAAFMGSRAGRRIAASDGKLRGAGMASAGLLLGVLAFFASAAWFLYFRFAIAPLISLI